MIGALGEVVFVVTAETMRTFQDFVRTSSARWAKHDRIGLKPKSQFLGPDLDGISFTMRFDANYGMNPKEEMDRLLIMNREGEAVDLTIGGKSLGMGLWTITALEQNWDVVDNRGNVLVGTAKITLEEYIE